MRFGTRLNGARFVQMPSVGSSSSVTLSRYVEVILLYPLLKWDGTIEFRKRNHLKSLPAPALDVAISGDKLYVLCGELGLRNVQYNENLTVEEIGLD